MKKLISLLLALMLLMIPAFAEEAAPAEEAVAEPVTPESFVGYWSAIGMLVEGEIVPPTAFTEFTLKTTVTVGEEGDCEGYFEGKYDGENWNTHPYWKDYDLKFESGFERSENGVVNGIGYVYWTLTEEGNLSLAYEGPEGNHTIIFEPAEAPVLANVIGTWVNTGVSLEGFFQAGQMAGNFTLNEDGTALHDEYGEGVWTQENGAIVCDWGYNVLWTYVINDTTLEYSENEGVFFIYELQ